MSARDIFHKARVLALLAAVLFIWLVLGMVYTERFPSPFQGLELVVLPWKGTIPPEAGLDRRLSLMQEIGRAHV